MPLNAMPITNQVAQTPFMAGMQAYNAAIQGQYAQPMAQQKLASQMGTAQQNLGLGQQQTALGAVSPTLAGLKVQLNNLVNKRQSIINSNLPANMKAERIKDLTGVINTTLDHIKTIGGMGITGLTNRAANVTNTLESGVLGPTPTQPSSNPMPPQSPLGAQAPSATTPQSANQPPFNINMVGKTGMLNGQKMYNDGRGWRPVK